MGVNEDTSNDNTGNISVCSGNQKKRVKSPKIVFRKKNDSIVDNPLKELNRDSMVINSTNLICSKKAVIDSPKIDKRSLQIKPIVHQEKLIGCKMCKKLELKITKLEATIDNYKNIMKNNKNIRKSNQTDLSFSCNNSLFVKENSLKQPANTTSNKDEEELKRLREFQYIVIEVSKSYDVINENLDESLCQLKNIVETELKAEKLLSCLDIIDSSNTKCNNKDRILEIQSM